MLWSPNAIATRKNKHWARKGENVACWCEGLKGRKFWDASSSVNSKYGLNLWLWIFLKALLFVFKSLHSYQLKDNLDRNQMLEQTQIIMCILNKPVFSATDIAYE